MACFAFFATAKRCGTVRGRASAASVIARATISATRRIDFILFSDTVRDDSERVHSLGRSFVLVLVRARFRSVFTAFGFQLVFARVVPWVLFWCFTLNIGSVCVCVCFRKHLVYLNSNASRRGVLWFAFQSVHTFKPKDKIINIGALVEDGTSMEPLVKVESWLLLSKLPNGSFFCLVQPLVLVSIIPTPNHPTQVHHQVNRFGVPDSAKQWAAAGEGVEKKNHPLSSRQPFAEKWRYLPASPLPPTHERALRPMGTDVSLEGCFSDLARSGKGVPRLERCVRIENVPPHQPAPPAPSSESLFPCGRKL